MKKYLVLAVVIVMILMAGYGSSSASAYPTKDIEVVIPFAPGGGSALTGMIFSQIMTEEKIVPVGMNLTYRPGGSAAVGMAYTAARRGDPYYLMLFTPSIVATPLHGGVGVSIDDFEVICVFGNEMTVLLTYPGRFDTLAEAEAWGKEHPGELLIGGAASGSSSHAHAIGIADAIGVDHTYVPFSGGGEVMAALMGKQIDLAVMQLNEVASHIEAGLLKPLGVGSAERLELLPDVPSYMEQGYNFTFQMPRGVAAPAGIPEEAKQFLADAFRKLVTSERWKTEFVDKFNFLHQPLFLEDARDFMLSQREMYITVFKLAGVIQ